MPATETALLRAVCGTKVPTVMSKASLFTGASETGMMTFYEEGIISYLFIEGSYNKRLDNLAEMPEKSLVCHFDKTDMRRVKEVLSDKFIIAGNVPASLMSTGTVDEVRACCDDLVELFQDVPGYILTHGCYFENTTDEKLCAFIDSVKK
jgi:uroporphyrinogen-III decarboxylase